MMILFDKHVCGLALLTLSINDTRMKEIPSIPRLLPSFPLNHGILLQYQRSQGTGVVSLTKEIVRRPLIYYPVTMR